MTGAKEAEVSTIESCQLGLFKPFDDCQDGGVYKPDAGILILDAHLMHAPVVGRFEILDPIGPSNNVL